VRDVITNGCPMILKLNLSYARSVNLLTGINLDKNRTVNLPKKRSNVYETKKIK